MKVIELSHVMAGPVCGLMLADMGADVIKVERLPGGDTSREDLAYTIDGESAAFMMMNRNKRGISVDLKSEGGRGVLHRLLEEADVILENYRTGTMERLGFGYDALHARYPRLIYCAVSGFGRSGPYAERGGFDLVAQGMCGLMSITGEGPGRPPVKVGAPVTDIGAGFLGAMGICAALHHRERTGQGQMVDTSLFDAGVTFTYWQSAIAFAAGQASQPMRSAHPLSADRLAGGLFGGAGSGGGGRAWRQQSLYGGLGAGDAGAGAGFAEGVPAHADCGADHDGRGPDALGGAIPAGRFLFPAPGSDGDHPRPWHSGGSTGLRRAGDGANLLGER
ncbi:MAG: CoA transferase [Kiloniellales bacterium]